MSARFILPVVCLSWLSSTVRGFCGETPGGPGAAVEHAAVLEIGGAAEWERGDGPHYGASVAVEITPIENLLELEFGVSALHVEDGTELSLDVLFKKPFHFSAQVEFMIGLGPALVHVPGDGEGGTFPGVEMVLDFMFWPSKDIGWYVEPGYDLLFHDGTQHGLGVTAGLLVGW
jgi:hypothetical protein